MTEAQGGGVITGVKQETVPSPCVSVCRMDEASGLCAGCLRSLEEIADWSTLGDAVRLAVWSRIAQRAGAVLHQLYLRAHLCGHVVRVQEAGGLRDAGVDLRLGQRALQRRQDRRTQMEHVVREVEVEERALPLLELRRRRQHVVGVPRRLGQRHVDHDDEVERVERAAEFLAYAEARAAAGRDARNAAIRAARARTTEFEREFWSGGDLGALPLSARPIARL